MTTNWVAPNDGSTVGEIAYALSQWRVFQLPSRIKANNHIAGLLLYHGAAWRTNLLVDIFTHDEPADYDCERIANCHCHPY